MRKRTVFFAVLGSAALVAALTACGSGTSSDPMPGMDHGAKDSRPAPAATAPTTATAPDPMSAMPGMDHGAAPMAMGDGLAATDQGFTFEPVSTTLSGSGGFAFRILGPGGRAVTAFEPDQTKLMHFYLVRNDLSGFQHVHPTMAADGTWTAPIAAPRPGTYRVYSSFVTKDAAGKPAALLLSKAATMPGTAADIPLPAAARSTTVDGYTVTVDSARLMAGHAMPLEVSISKDGKPVTDLEPYLETYAHLSAFHAGDQAMAHLHPEGAQATTPTGGPDLTFEATLPKAGDWRLFLQFQTGGTLHTAAVTLRVG